MEFQFLTPTQLWEGFNPVKEPLQTAVQSSVEEGKLQVTKFFFTSESVSDGKVRVFGRSVYKNDDVAQKPAIIIFPSLTASCRDTEVLDRLVERGYVIVTIDYANICKDTELHTTFPESLAYAEAENALSNLHYIGENARQTPWFAWAKIGRRAITAVEEMLYVDRDRIGIMGLGEGAQLTWILAGIDGRIKTAVPILAGGYTYYQDIPKFGQSKVPDSETQRVWIAGVGAETYSRSVSCPLYFATSSNNAMTDVDRAGDIMDNVPGHAKGLSISPHTNMQLTLAHFKGVEAWLEHFLKGDGVKIPKQKVAFENLDGELFLRCSLSQDPTDIAAFFSIGQTSSAARDWHELDEPVIDSNNGDRLFKIDFFDYDEQIFVFANFTFANGIVLSTPVLEVVPSTLKISAPTLPQIETSRIIYNNSFGLSSIALESDSLILNERLLVLGTGPFGIKGSMTTSGRLVSYKFGTSPFSLKKDTILQMDVYSKNERTITINMLNFEDNKHYVATKALTEGEIWQRINFTAADFKSSDNKPLGTFSEIAKTVFYDSENVLFNNIIWL